jgi:hypothetical protein
MSDSEILAGQDAELTVVTRAVEKTLSVQPIYSPETVGHDNIKKSSTRYFAPAGRIGAFFGAVKPEDIEIAKSSILFRPYWRVTGGYACRYRRRHSHKLSLENDVESVTIYGKDQSVTAERTRLSDLLAKVGADTGLGYGPVRISLSPLEGVLKGGLSSILGAKDIEVGKKVELEIKDIIETAAFAYTGAFLFDATSSLECEEIFDSLNGKDLRPAHEPELRKQGQVLEPTFSKEEAIEIVKDKIYREPEETPRKIIEHEFRISETSLIYIPFYELFLRCKGKTKQVRLNGITGKITEL